MTDLGQIETLAAASGLSIFGGFNTVSTDAVPEGTRALLLLGPAEPGFWPRLIRSPEWLDGNADPVDRWSARVIGKLADDIGAVALFPFGGPPWHPFYQWALRTGRIWESPVRLLVHDKAGLMASFRGALALPDEIDLPPLPERPCDQCEDQPCRSACPVSALTDEGYDLAACHSFLSRPEGKDCMKLGCAARRACPVSQAYARLPEQSAYHMRQFHK